MAGSVVALFLAWNGDEWVVATKLLASADVSGQHTTDVIFWRIAQRHTPLISLSSWTETAIGSASNLPASPTATFSAEAMPNAEPPQPCNLPIYQDKHIVVGRTIRSRIDHRSLSTLASEGAVGGRLAFTCQGRANVVCLFDADTFTRSVALDLHFLHATRLSLPSIWILFPS